MDARGPANPRPIQTPATLVVPQEDAHDNRRAQPRYIVHKSVTVIPVLDDGRLDWERRVYGCSIDLSDTGICFEVAGDGLPPSRALVVGVEGQDDRLHFTGVQVRHTRPVDAARIRVGAQIDESGCGILRDDSLAPAFDPHTLQFTHRVPAEIIGSWVDAGILRPVLCDRVLLCPRCHSLPTVRRGCRGCGSGRITNDRLIHHFACAHVGLADEFARDGELACPKCRARKLIVGADFEYLTGPFHCRRCGWSDTECEEIGHCLRCGLRFPMHQAKQQDLISYHVDRLEPLALIDS